MCTVELNCLWTIQQRRFLCMISATTSPTNDISVTYLLSLHNVPCWLGTTGASCSPSRTPPTLLPTLTVSNCERGSWQSWMVGWALSGPQPDPVMLGLPGANLWWKGTATRTRTLQTYQLGVEVGQQLLLIQPTAILVAPLTLPVCVPLYLHPLWDWYRYWYCLLFPLWGQCSTLLLIWWCYPLLRIILSEVEHDSCVLSLVKKTSLKKTVSNVLEQLKICQKVFNEFLEVTT